jgi:hypothetical protein
MCICSNHTPDLMERLETLGITVFFSKELENIKLKFKIPNLVTTVEPYQTPIGCVDFQIEQLRIAVQNCKNEKVKPIIEDLIKSIEKEYLLYDTDSKMCKVYVDCLSKATQAVLFPNNKTQLACIEQAKIMQGNSSAGKKIAGCLLILTGLLIIVAAITLTFSTASLSLGLSVPLSLITGSKIGAAGAATCCVGFGLFYNGREKGQAKAMNQLADLTLRSEG